MEQKSCCNGTTSLCGQGKKIQGGRYLCPHNNLGALYSHLILEWHESNDLTIYDYLPSSNKIVVWVCPKNECGCHIYPTAICNRTGVKSGGCPYCANKIVCEHNNLEVLFPGLKAEWHPDNGPMKSYFPKSGKRVKWICQNPNQCGCHTWGTRVADRTREDKQYGCPYCSGRLACKHDNLEVSFPELALEWHPDNEPITNYKPSSRKKVLWICKVNPCGCHIWPASINNRTSPINNTGCPFCAGKSLCPHNNFAALFPEIAKDWHPKNEKSPNEYSPGSSTRVWWICPINPCGCHEWITTIHSRTSKGHESNCPYCSNKAVCPHNNLLAMYPEIAKEWHPENEGHPEDYAPGSDKKVWWKCQNDPCGCHEWDTNIYRRTGPDKTGCPFCVGTARCIHASLLAHDYWHQISHEWDWDKNIHGPEYYAPHSDKKVWWVCVSGHSWDSNIANRIGKRGCPYCLLKTEQKLYDILHPIYANIVHPFKVDWCRNKKYLPFDFVLQDFKIIIELDGPQHFIQISNWSSPEKQFETDVYKMVQANKNGYSVIRLLQEDVFYDKYNWLTDLKNAIKRIKTQKTVQNVYICKNDEYINYILKFQPK